MKSMLFFIICIPILTLLISFISNKGTISDLRYTKRWWKSITKRGWWTVGLNFLIIVLLIWQYLVAKKENDIKDEALLKQKKDTENIITSKVDSSRKKLFEDVSLAFLKQELLLDTVEKTVSKIKDTSSFLRNDLVDIYGQQIELKRSNSQIKRLNFIGMLRKYRKLADANNNLQLTFTSHHGYDFALKSHNNFGEKYLTPFTETMNEIINIPFIEENNEIKQEWLRIRNAVYDLYYSFGTPYENDDRVKKMGIIKYDSLRKGLINKTNIILFESRKRIDLLVDKIVHKNLNAKVDEDLYVFPDSLKKSVFIY